MEPHLPAAILVLATRPFPDRQQAVAFAYATAHDFDVVSLCHTLDAAMACVLARTVVAVVCAFDPHDGGAIDRAGGELHVIRREDPRKRRTVDRLAARLARAGLDIQKIASVLEVDSREVRRLLGRRRRSGPDSGAE